MKKIKLLLMLFVFALLLNVSAVSLNGLEGNKETYYNISKTIEDSTFLNLKNYEVIKYAPPYYVIRSNDYTVYYDEKFISEVALDYYYDINTKEIKYQITKIIWWDLKGKFLKEDSYMEKPVSLENDDMGYEMAAMIFNKAYNNRTFLDNME